MKKRNEIEVDFIIDKLTNSIENTITGEVFETEVTEMLKKDSNQIKRKDWQFEWKSEFKESVNKVFKLTTLNNPNIILGLICLADKQD